MDQPSALGGDVLCDLTALQGRLDRKGTDRDGRDCSEADARRTACQAVQLDLARGAHHADGVGVSQADFLEPPRDRTTGERHEHVRDDLTWLKCGRAVLDEELAERQLTRPGFGADEPHDGAGRQQGRRRVGRRRRGDEVASDSRAVANQRAAH